MKKLEQFLKNPKEEYIDYKFEIEDYDKIIEKLEPIQIDQEIIDRQKFMDIITTHETNIENLYFIRMEQYGYADEDAVIYRICYTNNLEKQLEKCKEYMKNNDFIKMRNNT